MKEENKVEMAIKALELAYFFARDVDSKHQVADVAAQFYSVLEGLVDGSLSYPDCLNEPGTP